MHTNSFALGSAKKVLPGLIGALLCTEASAQQQELEEVVIVGSRRETTVLESPNVVDLVTEQELSQSGGVV
ncbi:hypothetical protein, partial [Steroidobacter sp.]|uniref:hypothetical protein n=1 Tax=Steroidobacter sp. TaxID=1978227 RepID=UPI001A364317